MARGSSCCLPSYPFQGLMGICVVLRIPSFSSPAPVHLIASPSSLLLHFLSIPLLCIQQKCSEACVPAPSFLLT